MQKQEFFTYSWHIDESEEDQTLIRVYGLDKNNRNICVRIEDFTPYVYLELPDKIKWNVGKAQLLGNKLDELLERQRALKKVLQYKKRLYGAHIDPETMERKLSPYLLCSFAHKSDIKALGSKLRRAVHVVGLGALRLKMHESDADPILQLTCCRDIPTAGWVEFTGKLVSKDDQLTSCDQEYIVKWKNLRSHESEVVPRPLIMGFDIEVNSTNPSAMPKAENPGDKIFQISCVLAREGEPADEYENYLLTLGDTAEELDNEGIIVYTYETEESLLKGFTAFIREYNPNLIVGYNILGFDIPYMIARAKSSFCLLDFDKQGFHKFAHAPERLIKWSSSAYKDQEFEFLDAEGRIYVDLLPLIKRDFKFNNYKLKTISEYFIGQTKDPLSVKGIFKCYRIGIKKNEQGEYSRRAQKAMAIVGKYCVQDSALVVRLTDKLKTWVGLTEMAKTCNVPIFTLYTQGQQIKVFSQLYKYCMYENIVVEKDGYEVSEDERYVGAKVFPPIPGRYKMVVPFDFASLYPTTIIAYNIDYHTWVPPGANIPDSMCHVMEWEDHQACEHDPKVERKIILSKYLDDERAKITKMRNRRNNCLDPLRRKEMMAEINTEVEKLKPYTLERTELTKTISKFPMCSKRSYRFLKEPKGVMPTVIQNLLDARKHTRKVDMVKCYKEIDRLKKDSDENGTDNGKLITTQKSMIDVLNKRQLAYKVSANSVAAVTPIPCQLNGEFVYRTIEELSKGDWRAINEDQELSTPLDNLLVWSDMGFTRPKHIMRHPQEKPLKRILTHTGLVDCTEDHSLLTPNGVEVKPCNLRPGDELMHFRYPLPKDTPSEPMYRTLSDEIIQDHALETEEEEMAFVHGLFFAEGTAGTWGERMKQKSSLVHLRKIGNVKGIGDRYRNLFYCERGYKRVPDYVMTAPLKVRQGFFMGYYSGDGARKLKCGVVVTNRSQIGTAGLMYIANSIGYKVSISTGKQEFFSLQCCKRFRMKDEVVIKTIEDVFEPEPKKQLIPDNNCACDQSEQPREYNTLEKHIEVVEQNYVYDIETENHHFAAGIGHMIVHNSMYGAMGVRRGYLPFMPGAMCTTYMGRVNIEIVAKEIPEKFGGELIYGDTDSAYVTFPHLKTAHETWDHALDVAAQVTQLFPAPIELEFEEEIYAFFFILSKKRYMYRKCLRDGVVEDKIGKKGVLLARRDNSKFVRDVYEVVVSKIAADAKCDKVLMFVLEELNKMCSSTKPNTDFVITKSVGDCGGLVAQPFLNEKGVRKAKVGNYTVPLLSGTSEEMETQMVKKGVKTPTDFYLACLPAQVQLAERMRRRGQRVDPGTRLEYVVSQPKRHTAKQYEKIESADYMAKHPSAIKIDFMYYLKALVNPLDQVLDVAFAKEKGFQTGFVERQYKFRWKIRNKVLQELKDLFRPKLVFD